MEEPALQQEKIEGSWEGGNDAGKAGWKNECSLSSLLKQSCFLCWSTPRDTDVMETDERVLTKTAEIRELENAVAVENLELQEQQSDRNELEDTLVKLENHKEKLVEQIKNIRQLCYEESQQILSLQADEMQKESQVEEYERELARARWRLRKLREEVKQAKRKVEEAGERNNPLQDSIRQSYEDILQEEHTLCSLSGGAVTPESQLEESTSPADTTEDDPLPIKPWGRSQSLPAYADLIMGGSSSSFCNNLADTREEADTTGSSSSKINRSDVEEEEEVDLDEGEVNAEGETQIEMKKSAITENPLSQMDFYQADPFAFPDGQSDHDLFNEDLFLKTDSSDGFTSDPFKGSDPFAADHLFPEENIGTDGGMENAGDEADTSLSCAENKASTGTQCFESEFPDEDSDIEINYSQEDLDAIALADSSCGFKPIQSSTEELSPQGWRSQGQYSVESDPNGYELDLGAVSPPSDIEEHSLGSLAGEVNTEAIQEVHQGNSVTQAVSADEPSSQDTECVHNNQEELRDSQNVFTQLDSAENSELNLELSYEQTSQSSFDPYGFKLSPEHSSHTLLDPDEAGLEPSDTELSFDPPSSEPEQVDLDHYGFDIASPQTTHDSDPYGFKLSPEGENQEVMDIWVHENQEEMDLCSYDNNEQVETSSNSNQEVLEPCNQEELEHHSPTIQDPLEMSNHGNQEVLEPSYTDPREVVNNENQEVLDLCSHDNQEVVEPYCDVTVEPLESCNQEVLEPCSYSVQELLDFSHPENQEVPDSEGNQESLDFGGMENQEVLASGCRENQDVLNVCSNQESLNLQSHDNQEILDMLSAEVFPEANNNQCVVEPEFSISSTNNSSDSDVASDDLLEFKLNNTSVCTNVKTNTNTNDAPNTAISNISATQDFTTSNTPTSHSFLEGDLGSVFGAGGYIGCPDVADDLEPIVARRPANPVAEPVRPVRPVRPPRPSLRAKEKAQAQGIDLK
ncbi:uncharacterized protein V6R79_011023 [Siganus canaliculatus]